MVTCVFVVAVAKGDLCVDYSDAELQRGVNVGAVPLGGAEAAVYRAVKTVHTLHGCVVSCCSSPVCDTVFLHNRDCYLLQCNSTASCQPHVTHDGKFNETYLLNVKPIKSSGSVRQGETSTTPAVTTTNGQSVSTIPCSPEDPSSCGPHDACHQVSQTLYVCQCVRGYTRNDTSKLCTEVLTCTFGLFDCAANMKCVPYNSRSRVGTCQCGDGFVRDDKTHECVKATCRSYSGMFVCVCVCMDKKNAASSPQKDSGTTTDKSSSTPMTTTTPPTTTTTTVSTTTTLQQLVVSAGENKVLQLPVDECTLSAYTVPVDTSNEYNYKWSLISSSLGDKQGKMSGIDTATCKLSELKAGFYMFQVAVSSVGKYGEAYVNVTVLQPARNNTAPVAVVSPTAQKVNQPNDVVIDGSGSTDDSGVVKYHWVQVSGPLNNQQIKDEEMSKPMLVLKGLSPGDYRFKLIVTDSDGAENSTIANVTLIKEKDYPPKANAGSNKIISLPKNAVTLFGNGSTDDKGIISYEWTKTSDSVKLAADMRGVRTPFLHLEHLEAGDYTFTLKVTDTAHQMSSADVHVFVKQETNQPPEARAGEDQTVFLPTDFVKLNGANSKDDQKIETYLWTQVSGPNTASIENADRVVATASKLVLGVYKFQLTVADAEKMESSSTITVSVKQNTNQPPVADAGGDQKLYLPVSLVSLDGSKSTDDKGIVSYKWQKKENSLAAGVVLNNSDKHSVLELTKLVAGRYIFELTVLDEEGLSSTDTASVVVMPYLYKNDLVEIYLKEDITEFTEANKVTLLADIALLMHKPSQKRELKVHMETLDMRQDIGW
ncbi:hypothetical protein NP493_323g02021 [Ridgeia piscesae]|uniref:EGF-like domain-containing protein n=1 Tax=Ridgeia piscesae TaxID=27915 RepID=A0AAD9L4X1_RIDPI|nr:hypothetical protein NP493_323g02021 [Ridgeia piscesae]